MDLYFNNDLLEPHLYDHRRLAEIGWAGKIQLAAKLRRLSGSGGGNGGSGGGGGGADSSVDSGSANSSPEPDEVAANQGEVENMLPGWHLAKSEGDIMFLIQFGGFG